MENEVDENSQTKRKDSVPSQMGDGFYNTRNPQPQLTEPQSAPNNNASSSSALVEATPDGCNTNSTINTDLEFFDSLPPGYRFCPFDEELILYYLKKRIMNEVLPRNKIVEVNLYKHNPEELAETYKLYGEKEWYFFTPRERKYPNGNRPNRGACGGYWKATGADKPVKFKSKTVGYRKALVFYRGLSGRGEKTNWIMHEYRVNEPPRCKRNANDMRLDDCILCRVYKKADKSTRTQPAGEFSPCTPEEGLSRVYKKADNSTRTQPAGEFSPCTLEESVEEVVEPKFNSNDVIHDSQGYISQPIQNGLSDIPQISYPSGYPANFVKREGPLQAMICQNYGTQPRMVEPVGVMPQNYGTQPRMVEPVGVMPQNYGTQPRMVEPVGVMPPLSYPPMDSSDFMSKYIPQESWDSKQMGFEEDFYRDITNIENCNMQSLELYYRTNIDPYLNLDNTNLPNNAPCNPTNPPY